MHSKLIYNTQIDNKIIKKKKKKSTWRRWGSNRDFLLRRRKPKHLATVDR